LRFADPAIERGTQLDQLRLLILSRAWRQMQFVVDAEFTRLDGFGQGRDAGLSALDQALEVGICALR
jgi:hypothetical protein